MKATEHIPEKKALLFDAAQGLMIDKGYVATTVDEICSAAGVTKGTFFHYFDNKEQLGRELALRFSTENGKRFCEYIQDKAGDDPRDRVYACLDACSEFCDCSEAKGCLVGTFAQEISTSHPDLRSVCDQCFCDSINGFAKDIAEAKEKYAPDADFDPRSLAEMWTATMQGAMVLAKAQQDRGVMQRTIAHYRKYVVSLLGE